MQIAIPLKKTVSKSTSEIDACKSITVHQPITINKQVPLSIFYFAKLSMIPVCFLLLSFIPLVALVNVTTIQNCPVLSPRSTPPNDVRDLRIDDIKLIAALGDRFGLFSNSMSS